MTHPLLTRAHLEAVLIATALVSSWTTRAEIRRTVDRDRLSIAAWALLTQITDGTFGDGVRTNTKTQLAIADRVDAITIADLCFYELPTLLALVNQLPERPVTPPAWEHHLQAVGEDAA